ncbi:MAG: hypothetical protein QF766_02955 [Candidatus Poseidoniia archaeon]|jgi:hypothetical protein|nr:hypothetical protein [Gemmatimonadota bacterium]MDP7243477.1 hypothetical protein [Candidatus Poseidoniia archaeon]MDP7535723.1 hypothetical protein [Candidatus Poseidoniia archaeon]MDP7607800.1 hypothetical protein [Candidatus Poseidoniia archaeon]HJP43799.1 hypothetical protein [Candidatus Poseidoniia archaeon]|tara:strand:+ start:246 stop:599 length:354 start_codon:yes stop_codon:yes gene_type:complete
MGENKKSGAIDSLGIGEAVDDIAAAARKATDLAEDITRRAAGTATTVSGRLGGVVGSGVIAGGNVVKAGSSMVDAAGSVVVSTGNAIKATARTGHKTGDAIRVVGETIKRVTAAEKN